MSKLLHIFLVGIALGFMAPSVDAGLLIATAESSAGIKGKIVDDTTGQPLAGVLVLASWHDFTPNYFIFGYSEGNPFSCYQLVNVLTAVSGPDGSYVFPEWKGKLGHCQYMAIQQPIFVYYKPGYSVLHTEVPTDEELESGPDHTVSEYDGYTTRMRPLGSHQTDREDNYVENLKRFDDFLWQALSEDEKGPCFWQEERPALLLLLQEMHRLTPYIKYKFDPFDDEYGARLISRSCRHQADIDAIEQEAIRD